MRTIAIFVALATWLAAAPGALAETASIKAFVGKWGGSAIAKNRDSIYFGVTIRDLDVTVTGDDDRFEITWTTVLRRGGTPEKPRIRRKSTTLRFEAAGPDLYRSPDAPSAGPGRTYSWARKQDNSLIVYLLMMDEKGVYELARYDRTVTGSGMDLAFSVIRDGEQLRSVTGRLVKHE